MLHLKRIINDYEFLRCKISNELIAYGDYYYEDDEDGLIVKSRVYHEIKESERRSRFDYSDLEKASSEREYAEILKRAEREIFTNTILDRKIAGKEQSY